MTRKGLKKKVSESEIEPPALKRTEGPWLLFEAPDKCGDSECDTPHAWHVKDEEGNLIAEIGTPSIERSDEAEGNARLIASSWRLLETAKMVIERWSSGRLDEAVRELHTAIDDIEGRE